MEGSCCVLHHLTWPHQREEERGGGGGGAAADGLPQASYSQLHICLTVVCTDSAIVGPGLLQSQEQMGNRRSAYCSVHVPLHHVAGSSGPVWQRHKTELVQQLCTLLDVEVCHLRIRHLARPLQGLIHLQGAVWRGMSDPRQHQSYYSIGLAFCLHLFSHPYHIRSLIGFLQMSDHRQACTQTETLVEARP